MSDTEWIQRSLGAARSDPVGMWQMVRVGRDGFGLSGSALESFVRRFIEEMVSGGTEPIVGDRSTLSGWNRASVAHFAPNQVADILVDEWRKSGIDPDVDGVWFAYPSVWR